MTFIVKSSTEKILRFLFGLPASACYNQRCKVRRRLRGSDRFRSFTGVPSCCLPVRLKLDPNQTRSCSVTGGRR
ncbi:hypothetical protein OJAV_G00085520 [Oryzias javanicus]|uniref:Uncharacterized protein n=1 Tax=Oryzias javanicus TaxID=123683 RepID=A0A3S2MVK3_ORYJA|nr:hypothetical protein OJAV_G00085520 [Oryzias javanicus]